jgi:hypothetical protein
MLSGMHHRRLQAALFLTTVLTSTGVHAGQWSYSLGGGSASGYASGDYVRFGATGLVAGSVGWQWRSRIALRAELSYAHYSALAPIVFADGSVPSPEWGVSLVPFSLGAVGYLRGEESPTPFVEVSPTLVWSQWYLDGTGSYDFDFSGFVPGLKAGLGLHFPVSDQLRIDMGMSYLVSGSGQVKAQGMRNLSAQDRFDGFGQFVPFGRLTLTR